MNGPVGLGAGATAKLPYGASARLVGESSGPGTLTRVGDAPIKAQASEPLVSVIMFVRNGMPHLKRAVESVLRQDYKNLEFVIQDGASTDGTVEYLRGLRDPRIKLVSEKDDGPADAFAKAVNRVKGEIIASCLADEELYPDALSRVVALFEKHPYLGAITGDADITDIHGDTYAKFEGGPFNLLKYLMGEYCPYWCSSFFKTDALRFVGIFDERWSKASLEFEIWVRLAIDTDILYVPEIFSKYAHHSGQLSQAGGRVEEELDARLSILRERLFGVGKFFGDDEYTRDVICLLQLRNLYQHLSTWNPPEAQKILKRLSEAGYLGEFNSTRGVSAPPPAAVQPAPLPTGAPEPAAPTPAASATQSPLSRPMTIDGAPVRDEFVPLHEYIVPNRGLGALYHRLTPRFVRAAIPRDLKVRLAFALGIRKK